MRGLKEEQSGKRHVETTSFNLPQPPVGRQVVAAGLTPPMMPFFFITSHEPSEKNVYGSNSVFIENFM